MSHTTKDVQKNKMKQSERRRHSRVPYGAWVEDLSREGGMQFFLALNLSMGGLLLVSSTPPPIGHKVHLRLIVENEARIMSLDGQVVRHSVKEGDMTGFAVRFIDLDDAQKSFLDELINECYQTPPPKH
jgi:hypothetical protein